jgi:hypothetical protein
MTAQRTAGVGGVFFRQAVSAFGAGAVPGGGTGDADQPCRGTCPGRDSGPACNQVRASRSAASTFEDPP